MEDIRFMNRIGIQILFLIFASINILGCSNDQSLLTHNETMRIDQNLELAYSKPNTAIEEYVARVGKRVLIVSDQPNANYKFLVSDNETPELSLSKEQNSITISHGLLLKLNDEAELAAALTMAMSKMAYYPDLDRNALTALARAGYDPLAMVDLQEQYYNRAEYNPGHWLSVIYSQPPTDTAIATNRAFAGKMSKGLLRGIENYHKHIKG